jgi:hypothetical protein
VKRLFVILALAQIAHGGVAVESKHREIAIQRVSKAAPDLGRRSLKTQGRGA